MLAELVTVDAMSELAGRLGLHSHEWAVGGGAGWETRTSGRRAEAEMQLCRVDAAYSERHSPVGNGLGRCP